MKSKWSANIGNFAPKIKRGCFAEPIDICFKMGEGLSKWLTQSFY